jgi:hypothetical protein
MYWIPCCLVVSLRLNVFALLASPTSVRSLKSLETTWICHYNNCQSHIYSSSRVLNSMVRLHAFYRIDVVSLMYTLRVRIRSKSTFYSVLRCLQAWYSYWLSPLCSSLLWLPPRLFVGHSVRERLTLLAFVIKPPASFAGQN